MAGMPGGMAEFLRTKYALMQQQADATTQNAATAALTGKAAANLDTVRAGLMPAESRANIGLVKANTGLAQANTRLVGLNADWLPRMNQGTLDEQAARTRSVNTETDLTLDDATRRFRQPQALTGGAADYFRSMSTFLPNWSY